MSYLTMFNLVGLDVPRRWQDGFRWVGNEMPQVPQLLQVFKKLVRKDNVRAYLNQKGRLPTATCLCYVVRRKQACFPYDSPPAKTILL